MVHSERDRNVTWHLPVPDSALRRLFFCPNFSFTKAASGGTHQEQESVDEPKWSTLSTTALTDDTRQCRPLWA